MKMLLRSSLLYTLGLALAIASNARADSVPEVLHYRFDGTGTTVPNLASSPPVGAENATIMGGVTQTGTDLNFGGGGFSLLGTGVASSSDYLNTGWAPNLGGGSWTISVTTSNISASTTLFYIFGDANTASFRCFTNGVAGPNNWILRGAGLTDIYINGAATVDTHRITFVYDNSLANVKGYLDGVLVTTVAQGAVNLSGTGPLKVMGYSTNVGAPLNGLVDDFRLYSRALSDIEVATLDRHSITSVTGNGVTILDGDSTPDIADHTDFGGTLTASGSITRTFTLLNGGNVDLTLGALTVTGPDAADFSVTAPPASPVMIGGNTTFDVTFDPSVDALRTATVNIPTSDGASTVFDFAIQGTGHPIDIFGNGFEN
jgi:Concanavalin A-like lectin/glucanases superfamily